jgi:electron transport complex protein RnfB
VIAASDIDRLLPQTQCERCGYPGCMPYAEAIAADGADINRCPPGGEATIAALAQLLGREPKPLDPECGPVTPPAVAFIDENICIGCTRCIQACPVDAIVGAAKQMHTVIEAECTGCELCLVPCPVDCIEMVPVARDNFALADRFRRRHEYRERRLAAERAAREARRREQQANRNLAARRAEIAAMVAAVRARRGDRL